VNPDILLEFRMKKNLSIQHQVPRPFSTPQATQPPKGQITKHQPAKSEDPFATEMT
jgi:hypothetical protein